MAANPGWHTVDAVLTETENEITYHQASNPEEDGLIPSIYLHSLWPNLHTITQASRLGRRLDKLLTEEYKVVMEQTTCVWTFIDCLPALPILRGAGTYINQWSVLWLRVLLQPVGQTGEGMDLKSIEDFLKLQDFRCIDITESNHPAIGYALFARDWQATLQPQIKKFVQSNATFTDEISALTTQCDALAKEAATLSKERDGLMVKQQVQDEQLITLRKDLRDAMQTASLSVKIQTLRESDLRDLQMRYQSSLSTQEEQRQLLVKLSERLSVASSYFHQMVNDEITLPSSNNQKTKITRKISSPRTKHIRGKARRHT